MATLHDPKRISIITRHLRPSFTRPPRRRSIITASGSARFTPFPTHAEFVDSLPTTPLCPASGCPCAEMPSGLDIDHDRPLIGTIPRYSQHVVVRTGRSDWGSKIENEDSSVEGAGMNFAKSLKGLVGRGGKFHHPRKPILITNCSLPGRPNPRYSSVHVFPQHVHVPKIPHTREGHEAFVSQFLFGARDLSLKMRAKKVARRSKVEVDQAGFPIRNEVLVAQKPRLDYVKYTSPTILICGHNSRDTRCGKLGPLLLEEFNSYIGGQGRHQLPTSDERSTGFRFSGLQPASTLGQSRVGLTSHIGGHTFAGNVILYLPKQFTMASGEVSPLAGMGIWYGRVEPRHVWGIMEETVQRGCVVKELLRGIHEPSAIAG